MMIRRKLLLSLIYILLGLLLVNCSANRKTTVAYATTQPSAMPTRTARPTQTPSSQPIQVTHTSAPPQIQATPRSSATAHPKASATALPAVWGVTPLDAENARQAIQRAVWGAGLPQGSAFAAGGEAFIQQTVFGIFIYDADTMQLIGFLPEAQEFFLSPSGDLLFTRLPDGKVQVVSLPEGEKQHEFEPIATLSPQIKDVIYAQLPKDRPAAEAWFFDQVSRITALAISPDGRTAAIGFGDASVGLWDLTSSMLVKILKNDIVNDISGLIFSPNGENLLATGHDSDVAVWQVADGKLLWRLPHIGHIVGQPFSADGSHLALETTQGTSAWTAVHNTRYGEEVGQKVVGVVASNAISPDNTRLLTTWYNTVKLWSIPGLTQMEKITTDLNWPRASYSADGKHILLNEGEQAYLTSDLTRDLAYPSPIVTPMPELNPQSVLQAGHFTDPVGLRFPKSDQAYSWGRASDSSVWVNDLQSEKITTYSFGSPLLADPDLSPSGDRLAACTQAGLLVVSLADGKSQNLGRCRGSGAVRFSADGKTIFKANTTLIDALDSQNGQLLYNLRGHQFLVEGIEVINDGKYLVSSSNFQGSQGRELILWRVDEPQQLRRWIASVLPASRLLAAVIDDEDGVLYTALGGLRGWRLGDGLPHHLDTSGISSLVLSPDGELLAKGDDQGNIHLYTLDTWEELAVLQGHRQPVTRLIFSPDGASLLSVSADGTIRLWGLP